MNTTILLLVAAVAYLFYRVRQLSHELKKKADRPFYQTYTPPRSYFPGLEGRFRHCQRWPDESDDLGGSEE